MLNKLTTTLCVVVTAAGLLFLPARGTSQQYDLDDLDDELLVAMLFAELDDVFVGGNPYQEIYINELADLFMRALSDAGDEFVGDEDDPYDDQYEQFITSAALEAEIDEFDPRLDLYDVVMNILMEFDSRYASLDPSRPYVFLRVLGPADGAPQVAPAAQYTARRLGSTMKPPPRN